MKKNYILSYTINKILLQHVKEINKNINFILHYSLKTSNKNYFSDIFKSQLIKEKSNIFIYNISIVNLLVSLHSKFLYSSNIYFHLHDPKPHSGLLNVFIFILQTIQVSISKVIFVFDEELIKDVNKYYFIKSKEVIVLNHGAPIFKKNFTNINQEKINCGFFGRNMPYKNLNGFLELVSSYSYLNFHIFGTGYDFKNDFQNLKIHNRFIENDEYYSFMIDMDYIIIPYKDISFSGIISDSIALKKKMVVSDYVFSKYQNKNFIKIKEFDPIKINYKDFNFFSGWKDYSQKIKELIK